jgi:hypothetical protein
MLIVLSAEEMEQFTNEGYVRLASAFPRKLASQCRKLAAEHLEIDESNPEGWEKPVVRGLVEGQPLYDAANSPRLVEAVGQLLDPDHWQDRPNLGAFVVRFPNEDDPGDTGWHIDSSFQPPGSDDWYVNYRSKERGLLLLCLLSDVGADDAPTCILPGSHLKMPALLHPFGEGGIFGLWAPLPDTSGPIALATGEAGDVYLCHPFLVHAASWPHRGVSPRYISQPPISLSGPFNLDGRSDSLSPVARTIRHGLSED